MKKLIKTNQIAKTHDMSHSLFIVLYIGQDQNSFSIFFFFQISHS